MTQMKLGVFALLSFCGFISTAIAKTLPEQPAGAVHTLVHDGLTRDYLLLPPAAAVHPPYPIIIALHGGSRTATDWWGGTDLPRLAHEKGAIFAAPNAVNNTWNDHSGMGSVTIDDVGFLSHLIDELVAVHGGDPRRVVVTGISNGGSMSMTLACEIPGKIDSIAPVAITLPQSVRDACMPETPLSVYLVNGTSDNFISYGGGFAGPFDAFYMISATDTFRFWADKNGCSGDPVSENIPDVDLTDGSTVTLKTYVGCADGTRVTQATVHQGGHSWPGGVSNFFIDLIFGLTNEDIDMAQEVWTLVALRPVGPEVMVTSNNTTVQEGDVLTVQATAKDSLGVDWIGLYTQGPHDLSPRLAAACEDTTLSTKNLPCSASQNTTSAEAGVHRWFAVGRNRAGDTQQSPEKTMTVTPSSPESGKLIRNMFLAEEGLFILWSNVEAGTELKIFNSDGLLVRRLVAEGSGDLSWDGLDDLGNPVPSGVYFSQKGGQKNFEKLIVRR